ncbi:MAG: sterol desaturase family protein, partial [Oleiphilaceae bacterium]|nr:sterol desaturase family protein [Oleiphilaceae bacterium]
HHSDLELDFTTSLRHHPLELALVLLLASPVIFLLELGWATVAFYILVSELVALCAHSNIRLPQRTDSALSKVLVTPSFHRRHHSRHRKQTDSHYGQIFTIWDRLFRSYAPYNVASDTEVEVGLNQYPKSEDTHLHKALTLPFTQHKPDQ